MPCGAASLGRGDHAILCSPETKRGQEGRGNPIVQHQKFRGWTFAKIKAQTLHDPSVNKCNLQHCFDLGHRGSTLPAVNAVELDPALGPLDEIARLQLNTSNHNYIHVQPSIPPVLENNGPLSSKAHSYRTKMCKLL